MSALWSDDEQRALSQIAAPGVSADEIQRQFNARRGTRKRSRVAIVHMMNQLRLSYGGRDLHFWTWDEDQLIRAMAGRCTVVEIVAALQEQCGHNRTENAVRKRIQLHGLESQPSEDAWISTWRLAPLLGHVGGTIIIWCDDGDLRCERFGKGKHSKRLIRPAWVDELIAAHPMRFDPASMPRGRFRSRVELRQREGRFLTTEQAGVIAGRDPRTISLACQRGQIIADKAKRATGSGRGRWWIKAADLEAWRTVSAAAIAS